MSVCIAGHTTTAPDFCDQCGLPVVAEPEPAPPAATAAEPADCPNCGTPRQPGALFCESCGYDFTTGALPTDDLRTQLGLPPLPGDATGKPAPGSPGTPDSPVAPVTPGGPDDPRTNDAPDSPGALDTPGALDSADSPGAPGSPAPAAPDAVQPGTATPDPADGADGQPGSAHPAIPRVRSGAWVAEVWVDPQWYALQESDDPLPTQSPPRIVPLRDSALIGRRSVSRNIHPDIDCEPDVGCSRRQAYLTYAQGQWYVNDLDSSNGTYVAAATAPLPTEPITERTQITPDTRVYVGAWTRIVVRQAIPEDTPVTLPGPEN